MSAACGVLSGGLADSRLDGVIFALADASGLAAPVVAGFVIAGLACGLAFAVHFSVIALARLWHRLLQKGLPGQSEAKPPARGV